MIRLLAILFGLFFASVSTAQDFPAAYSTTGVEADDVLNIRAEPTASAAIIGELGPYTINVEVLELSPDGRWGLVSTGEGNGWASMRYLARQEIVGENELPRPLVCSGTEPFWTLGIYPRGDEFQILGDERRNLMLTHQATAPNGFYASFEEGPTLERRLIVQRLQCNDGMSDRRFGFTATLFNEAPDGNSVLHGCCTLDAR